MPNRQHKVRQPPRPTNGKTEGKDQFHISIPIETLRVRMADAVEHARKRKPYPLRIWEKDWSKYNGNST